MAAIMTKSPSAIIMERLRGGVPDSIVIILIFQNLFNALSPYITVAMNLAVALALLIRCRGKLIRLEPAVLLAAYFVLAWLLVVAIYRGGEVELFVLLKYARVALFVTLFTIIFATYPITIAAIIKALNFSLAFHVLLVFLQIKFPDLSSLTAPIFGFTREETILEQYTLRKLGASSSYDTASLLSVSALLFFYIQYAQKKGNLYLFMAVASFIATLMSSRTGIALSLLIVGVICFRMILVASLIQKIVAFLVIVIVLSFGYQFILPLFIHSLGGSELSTSDAHLFFAAADYGTSGTLHALTDDHLQPLKRPIFDLFIGYVVDPNTIGRPTDVGYVKFVYHVGILGATVIILAHLYMLAVIRNILLRDDKDREINLIGYFLFCLIVITLAFNYKSLEIHSRGIGDIIYMLFLFLVLYRKRKNSKLNSPHHPH
jgi:hypothetical protein